MANTPEGKVKKKIKYEMLRIFPSHWSFMPVQTGYGQHGVPDFVDCVPVTITPDMVGQTVGLFVGIEAKTTDGTMSDWQMIQRDRILQAEGIYLTIYGIDDIRGKLKLLEDLKSD